MQQPDIDHLARALARRQFRRRAVAALGSIILGVGATAAAGKGKKKRDSSKILERRRRKAEQRKGGKKNKDAKNKGEGFARDCKRFVLAAGPDRDDKFRHIDDDVLIELIPKGKKGSVKILLDDDNNSPNGDDGAHLKVNPFTAKLGDKVRIVARNEVVGGCEIDEIWIHCIDGRGGKVKLTDAITPEECRSDEARIGVFEDRTVRIRNK